MIRMADSSKQLDDKAMALLQTALPINHEVSIGVPSLEAVEPPQRPANILSYKELGTKEGAFGKLATYGFIMDTGHTYSAQICTPKNQISEVPIVGTTAWLTSIQGHNEHTARKLAEAGFASFFVGAEGSYRPKKNCSLPNTNLSLLQSAAAVLAFSELARDITNTKTNHIKVVGESRGSMSGFGIIALASDFGQIVEKADLTAPCFPRKLRLSDISKLPEQAMREPLQTIKLLGRLSSRALVHYPATLDLHPRAMMYNALILPALMSGEAGELARASIAKSPETLLHLTCFADDVVSMRKEWGEILRGHPNARITPLSGSHLTIADPMTLAFVIARARAYDNCIANGIAPTPTTVFDASHELVGSYRQ